MLMLDHQCDSEYADLAPIPIDELIDAVDFSGLSADVALASLITTWCRSGVALARGSSASRSRPLPSVCEDGEYYVSVAAARAWVAEVVPLRVRAGIVDEIETSTFEPAPCQPTSHRPGSVEKIEVLKRRYKAGESLHHECDARGISASGKAGAGKKVDQTTIDRAIELWKCHTPVGDIAELCGVSKTAVRLWTKDLERPTQVVEPWLLRGERYYLETGKRPTVYIDGTLDISRLMLKLGVDSRDQLQYGYEQYKKRQAGIAAMESRQQKAEEARVTRGKEDLRTGAVKDLLARVEPNSWDNLDVHDLYRVVRIALRNVEDHHLKEDLIQDLVALAPYIISRLPCREDGYLVKTFRSRARWVTMRNYRSQFNSTKDQRKHEVEYLRRIHEEKIDGYLECADLSHCPACGELTHNTYCSPRCSTAVINYRRNLIGTANDCRLLLNACNPLEFISRDEIIAATGFSLTGLTAVLSALHCLGYRVELSEAGYRVSGLSKLDHQTTWLKSPQHQWPSDLALLRVAGVRLRYRGNGEFTTGEDLSVEQQLMLYRLFPWANNCVVCGIDTVPDKPESLTGNMRMSMTCTQRCQDKIAQRRNRKGWKV